MRASSAFSMYGLVTSRSALAAESCAAIFATRVLRCTCTPRYQSEATTPNAPIACAIALIASQFIWPLTALLRPATSRLLWFVANLQDDFPAGMTEVRFRLRFTRIGQRKSFGNDDFYFSLID